MAEQEGNAGKNVIDTPIEGEMQSSYIDYAMSVIVGRALPDARDGLKPAQRRTLYAMYMLGNTHDKPTKKSARIVGEVLGKYHPHGDIAAYETLVRMAQYFSMNYMLVEGQGNMGSVDGDPPAAQRYTEVRLRSIAEEMLEDLDKNAVDIVPNFDNTEKEPVVLPSKVPNLLINGSSGIAVGVATNILPHNLSEVCDAINAYLGNMEIDSHGLLDYVKGPDFPTRGIVFYDSELVRSYITGRGSVTIRGRARIEDGKKRQIIIEEIPYTVNKATLVAKIAELSKEKKVEGISGLRDESDKEGIRIVIELKGDASPDYVLNALYKHSQLQISLPVMNVAVMGNKLLNLTLRDFIKIFVGHRLEVVKRRTGYDLEVASERLHMIEGLRKAIDNIERVTALIKSRKNAKEAKEALMGELAITEKQAAAILDMKLGRLTSLESEGLREEGEQLGKSIEDYNRILSDDKHVFDIIRKEISDIKGKYGVKRKTDVEQNAELVELTNEDVIKDEDSVIILTQSDYVKRLPAQAYKLQERGGKGVITIELKEGDLVKEVVYCRSKDYLLLLSNLGRLYWLKAYRVPEGGRYSEGRSIANLLDLKNESIVAMFRIKNFETSDIVFLTSKGQVKRASAGLFSKPRATGVRAISLGGGDEIADAIVVGSQERDIVIATRNGKSIRFSVDDVRSMGRSAAGVRGIRLRDGDTAKNLISAGDEGGILTVSERGYGKITEIARYRMQGRGGGGVINLRVNEKTGPVAKALFLNREQRLLLINSRGVSIMIPIASIRVAGRAASGVRLMKVEQGTRVIDARLVEEEAAKEGSNENN